MGICWQPRATMLGVWQIPTFKELLHLKHHGVADMAQMSHGMYLPRAGSDIPLTLISEVAFSPDGRTLAITDLDRTASVWNVQTGQEMCHMIGEPLVNAFAFSPDGKMMATISKKGAIIWDLLQTGQELQTLNVNGYLREWAFNKNRTKMAIDSFNETSSIHALETWDVNAWQQIWHKNTNYSATMSFSPDGKMLLVACSDGVIKFLDVLTGNEIHRFDQSGPISYAVFSPDEKMLLVACSDSVIKILDVPTYIPQVEL
jgi:WD40 repeat protein